MNEVDNYAKFLCDHEHVIDVDQEKSHHRLARYTPNFQTEKQLESAVRRLNAFEKKARFFELIRSWASLKHEYRENAARKRLVLTLPAHSNVLLKRQGHSGSTQHPAPSTQLSRRGG